jgi:hypothetical protein
MIVTFTLLVDEVHFFDENYRVFAEMRTSKFQDDFYGFSLMRT